MQTVTFNNGVEMPMMGFGVYQIPDLRDCERAVRDALDVGYRCIDTAAVYGNEEAVGRAIRASGIPRSEIFVTTKVWIQDAGYEKTHAAFQRSLNKLGLDQLDLYLIHHPYGDVHGAWRAMEELAASGRVRSIGVSNFAPDRLMDLIIHHRTVPALNQLETHPFFQQRESQMFMESQGVRMQSWAPFAEGRNALFSHPVLTKIGLRHGKSSAQVVLRWLLLRGVVVIPKSVRRERMVENFSVFDFELGPEELAAIESMDTGNSLFFDQRSPKVVKRMCEHRLADA